MKSSLKHYWRRWPTTSWPLAPTWSQFIAVLNPGRSTRSALIHLGEHLNQLTGRDLRQLETRVPLGYAENGRHIAVEIGREGREGKPIGTMFVVGDSRKVLASSHPLVSTRCAAIAARNATWTTRGFARGSRRSPNSTERSSFRPKGTSRRRPVYRCLGVEHHALQRTGRAPLGRGGHQPAHQSRGGGGAYERRSSPGHGVSQPSRVKLSYSESTFRRPRRLSACPDWPPDRKTKRSNPFARMRRWPLCGPRI